MVKKLPRPLGMSISGIPGHRMNAKIPAQLFAGLLRESYFYPAVNGHVGNVRKSVFLVQRGAMKENTHGKIRNALALFYKV